MVSPVLSRGKIQVSTWNEKAARRLSARARHTFKEAKYSHVWRAEHSLMMYAKQILNIIICLVKSKTCRAFAFANLLIILYLPRRITGNASRSNVPNKRLLSGYYLEHCSKYYQAYIPDIWFVILLLPGICIEIEFDLIAENRNMNSNLIDCLLASFKLKDYQKNYGKVTQMQFN